MMETSNETSLSIKKELNEVQTTISVNDLGTHISRLLRPPPKLHPICKERKPNAYGYYISMSFIPIKWMLISSDKHCLSRFYSLTDMTFIFIPTLVWKGEIGYTIFLSQKVLPSLEIFEKNYIIFCEIFSEK